MAAQTRRRVKLIYPTRLLDQPILYRMITELGIQVNVLEAEVSKKGGWLTVDLAGASASVIRAMEWLADQGIDVSVVSVEIT